jgi:hypothetical protein
MPPLGLGDEEFSMITQLARPLPFGSRGAFIRQLVAEISVAGAHNSASIRAVGQKLQLRFLGVSVVGADD